MTRRVSKNEKPLFLKEMAAEGRERVEVRFSGNRAAGKTLLQKEFSRWFDEAQIPCVIFEDEDHVLTAYLSDEDRKYVGDIPA